MEELEKLIVEILFYDLMSEDMKFQTRLDEKVAGKLVGWNSSRRVMCVKG